MYRAAWCCWKPCGPPDNLSTSERPLHPTVTAIFMHDLLNFPQYRRVPLVTIHAKRSGRVAGTAIEHKTAWSRILPDRRCCHRVMPENIVQGGTGDLSSCAPTPTRKARVRLVTRRRFSARLSLTERAPSKPMGASQNGPRAATSIVRSRAMWRHWFRLSDCASCKC